MERISPFSFISSSYTPVIATAFCCLFVFFLIRLSFSSPTIIPRKTRSKKSSSSSSSSSSDGAGRGSCNTTYNHSDSLTISCTTNGKIGEINFSAGGEGLLTTGGSMMEQLVPEIMTHTLSYLDYRSLCRLSMTNSSMRREANDDNAWKLIYHKDFTAEQDSVTPPNGWKAYYAATRAVVTVNAAFYEIIRERSLPAMGHFWLNADYVQCVHGSGDLFTGYDAVIQSWHGAFNWAESDASQIRDVRVRVLSDMAWVTMKAYDDMEEAGPFHVTNVYEFHKGQWYMVHHHSSLDERLDQ